MHEKDIGRIVVKQDIKEPLPGGGYERKRVRLATWTTNVPEMLRILINSGLHVRAHIFRKDGTKTVKLSDE